MSYSYTKITVVMDQLSILFTCLIVTVLEPQMRRSLAEVSLHAGRKVDIALQKKDSKRPGPMIKGETRSIMKTKAVVQQSNKAVLPDFILSDSDSDDDFIGFDSNQLLNESLNITDYHSEFVQLFGEIDDEDFNYFTIEDIGNAPVIETPQRYPKRLSAREKKYIEDELSDEDEYLCDENVQCYHNL
jgi:hypothetical protein